MAPGSTTHMQRTMSSWKLKKAAFGRTLLIAGLIGQYGSELVNMYAAQPSAAQTPI